MDREEDGGGYSLSGEKEGEGDRKERPARSFLSGIWLWIGDETNPREEGKRSGRDRDETGNSGGLWPADKATATRDCTRAAGHRAPVRDSRLIRAICAAERSHNTRERTQETRDRLFFGPGADAAAELLWPEGSGYGKGHGPYSRMNHLSGCLFSFKNQKYNMKTVGIHYNQQAINMSRYAFIGYLKYDNFRYSYFINSFQKINQSGI